MTSSSAQSPRRLAFTKGHGTENDFVLVPDPEGTIDLAPSDVAFLADRRAGIGGDGVIRVVPTVLSGDPVAVGQASQARWFMDYRNADGSVAEMCGNGTRVFAAYLRREGLETADEFAIATRAGVKHVHVSVDPSGETRYSVNLGPWALQDEERAREQGSDALVKVAAHDAMPALSLDLGNPHTVVALPEDKELDELDLHVQPAVNPAPTEGTNVEFVRPVGPGHLAMRVFERGVGETRSCGTGAAAAALAIRWWAGGEDHSTTWTVDVPGGTVYVRPLPGQEVELSGPAALVADGEVTLP